MKSLSIFLLTFISIMIFSCISNAAEVGLRWDHNEPLPDGYKVYERCGEDSVYDYENPIWVGSENHTTEAITVDDGTKCYFVVRAYAGEVESADSNEVNFYRPKGPLNIRALLWAIIKSLFNIE